jgi:hypothetical protein
MIRADPTIVFLNRMDRYRITGDAWMFFIKCYYHIPGIAARLALTPIDRRVVHITDLKVTFPGIGEGTRLMRLITDMADDARVVLSLDARSFGEIAIPDDRLISWYRRFKFRETVSDVLENGVPMARFPTECVGVGRHIDYPIDDEP